MSTRKHKWSVCLLAATMMISLLGGCDTRKAYSAAEDDGPVTLWVLAEDVGCSYNIGSWDRESDMRAVLKQLAKEYETGHEGVTVELEFLPSANDAPEERERRLEQLRTEIIAGGGPDVYLLPGSTGSSMLFPDVVQSMRSGLFYDISAFYDADDGLGKETLVTAVMDAGLVGEARYVLPLRYNCPVIYTTKTAIEGAGLNAEELASGVNSLYDALTATKDPDWTRYAWPWYYRGAFSVFPGLIDYDTQSVALTVQDVAEYLRRYQMLSSVEISYPQLSSWDVYASRGVYPLTDGYVEYPGNQSIEDVFASAGYDGTIMKDHALLYAGSLDEALDIAIVAQTVGMELEMFPLRAADGSLIAIVTYWGAVGAGSGHPELAYEFLRLSLLEDTQWERNRPLEQRRNTIIYTRGRVTAGWPVRTVGSAEALWEQYRKRIAATSGTSDAGAAQRIRNILRTVSVTAADIPLLDVEINEVRFGLSAESTFRGALMQLSYTDPAEIDVVALAEELIDTLRWHISEG